MAESPFRPSAAHRWLKCTASVNAIAQAEAREETPSVYAAQGTLAHEMFARMVRRVFQGSSESEPNVGEAYEAQGLTVVYDQEMADVMDELEAYLRILEPALFLSEVRTRFRAWHGHTIPGTADVLAWGFDDPRRPLHVMDLKYGQGVHVSAELNPQLMLYALGALEEYACLFEEVEHVTLHIMQPRIGSYSVANYSINELVRWADNVVSPAIRSALSEDAKFHPDDATCRFCPLMPCAAAVRRVAEEFDFLQAQDYAISDENLSTFLDNSAFYQRVIDATREHARGKLLRGEEVEGWKLVAGRKRRDWSDADAVEAFTGHLHMTQTHVVKLNSPSAMEKSIGRSQFRELGLVEFVTSTEGSPTMVPASDKRPEWVELEPSEFENVTENGT